MIPCMPPSDDMQGPADLVITDASVYTNDRSRSWAKAIAVKGDRIQRIGADSDSWVIWLVRARRCAPSLVASCSRVSRTRISTRPSPAVTASASFSTTLEGRTAYLDAIAEYARTNPDEPWIVGGGWAMEYFPGGLPTKEDLDAIVPDRPVFIFNRDVHGAWVNSKALEIAGITKDTADPSDGIIERDPDTGEPTGMLHEGAAYTMNDTVIPLPSREEWEAGILNAQAYLHSLGITGWQDAWVTPGTHDGVSLAVCGGGADRKRRRLALVGSAPGARTDSGVP